MAWACASEISIWARMNSRSLGMSWKAGDSSVARGEKSRCSSAASGPAAPAAAVVVTTAVGASTAKGTLSRLLHRSAAATRTTVRSVTAVLNKMVIVTTPSLFRRHLHARQVVETSMAGAIQVRPIMPVSSRKVPR